jgi:hypothetical protein
MNQFITEELRNKFLAIKSWFTVVTISSDNDIGTFIIELNTLMYALSM